jgi:hypothetical protein
MAGCQSLVKDKIVKLLKFNFHKKTDNEPVRIKIYGKREFIGTQAEIDQTIFTYAPYFFPWRETFL